MSEELRDAYHEAQGVCRALEDLGIVFKIYEHPPVLTTVEAEQYWADIPGVHCKNLFLRNKKGNSHYLVLLKHSKQIDLKRLAGILGEDTLSFASAERLKKHLGLFAGAVSPFGLLNDEGRTVQVVIDSELAQAKELGFHPNTNTATITLSFTDFQKFLTSRGNAVRFVRTESSV